MLHDVNIEASAFRHPILEVLIKKNILKGGAALLKLRFREAVFIKKTSYYVKLAFENYRPEV